MRRSLSAIILTIALTGSAASQDASRWQRAIDALPSPVTAERLGSLAADDPNAYVYYLQNFLMDRGLFKGEADGQLRSDTIGALLRYCRERGISKLCSAGPLLPQATAAIAQAVATDLVPRLPDTWQLDDNGRRGSLGIAVEIAAATENSATLRFTGTAERQGYYNVTFGEASTASPDDWTARLSAAQQITPGSTERHAIFAVAMIGDTTYVGNLFPPTTLAVGDTPKAMEGTGAPAAEARTLVPLVQLYVFEGDVIDTTLTLADPSFERQ